MEKVFKRILSLALAVLMVISYVPAASAETVITTVAELQDAIDAAAEGETITVGQILSVSEGEIVALDLKGKTVELVSIYNSGDLTVTNGTLIGTDSEESVIETSAGSLTLEGVTASGPPPCYPCQGRRGHH